METEWYCPFCRRVIVACNQKQVESGEHDVYLFIHDDNEHPEDFPEAYEVMH